MSNDFTFLNNSEIKHFSTLYEESGGDDNGITYSSLKEIVLSYDRFSRHIAVNNLNIFAKRLKEVQVNRINEGDMILCNNY
jgi:hypothetical protein